MAPIIPTLPPSLYGNGAHYPLLSNYSYLLTIENSKFSIINLIQKQKQNTKIANQ